MSTHRVLVLALVGLVVSGCATTPLPTKKWSKAGVTYDDFLKDRYACIQDARGHQSSSFVQGGTPYGPGYGAASSRDAVNGGIFMACMAARGYRFDMNGEFGPPPGGEVFMR
jgi:hypothetical protein